MGERADYQRKWRKASPEYANSQAASRARGRALVRLRALYPNVFEKLLNEERAVEGLAPVYSVPLGRPPKRVFTNGR